MGIDWSHLPGEVIKKVCMCPMANGFRHDPESGYFVHAKCGKPTIPVAVKKCDTCGVVFVPQKYEKVQKADLLGIECDECDPPNRVRRGKLNF